MSRADILSGDQGDDAVFSLLMHPAEPYRLLGASRRLHNARRLFAKKENAEALIAQIEREPNEDVRDHLAALAGAIDADGLALTDKIEALGASAKAPVRRSMAFRFLFQHPTPRGFALVGSLLSDSQREVRQAAVLGLSNTASFGPSPACKPLEDALGGPNADLVAAPAASLRRCPGLPEKVLVYVDKQTADVSKVTNDVGIDYSLAAAAVCDDPRSRGVTELSSPSPATRRTAFQVAIRLTSKLSPDPNTRKAAMNALVACDPTRARVELAKLKKDPDSFVADSASTKLESLGKKR